MSFADFYKDPGHYIETACDNAQKMPMNRVIKIGTRSMLVGTLACLATVGLSSLTGSNTQTALATGVSLGIVAATINGVAGANEYGPVKQTKDKVNQTKDKLVRFFNLS